MKSRLICIVFSLLTIVLFAACQTGLRESALAEPLESEKPETGETYCPEESPFAPSMGITSANIQFHFVADNFLYDLEPFFDLIDLGQFESFHEFVEFDEEMHSRIVFTTEATVRNFRFIEISYNFDTDPYETIVSNVLYSLEELSPETPFVVTWRQWGIFPHRGISFVDENGTTRYFSIDMSTESGSLMFTEIGR